MNIPAIIPIATQKIVYPTSLVMPTLNLSFFFIPII